jgi:subtilisin family serine protease
MMEPIPADDAGRQDLNPSITLSVVDSLLERHGARILRASEVVRQPCTPPPLPTVYRYGTLLVRDDLDDGVIRHVNGVLGPHGFVIDIPEVGDDAEREPPAVRTASLRLADNAVRRLDAWTALQLIESYAKRRRRRWWKVTPDVAKRISLEHVLIGSALAGAGTLGGTNSPTHGGPDVNSPFDGPRRDLSGRLPVQVVLPEPDRPPVGALNRRPVIAVLDTGYYVHPWLSYVDRATTTTPTDEFVIVDSHWQELIYQHGLKPENNPTPTVPIQGYLDTPPIGEPLSGVLYSHFGHFTYIAGLIRQIAPHAQVLSVRVMHPDGLAYEGTVLHGLDLIRQEVIRARNGDANALPVDIVSISLGFFPESPAEESVLALFKDAIDKLTDLGVTVVAAAGNYATSRKFYPAALANVTSVGASNPNRTVAHFSNQAAWVDCFAPGAALVSTFPTVDGSQQPAREVRLAGTGPPIPGNSVDLGRRQTPDPDDYSAGWAVWSGSSFAAPWIAAKLAAALVTNAMDPCRDLGLEEQGVQAAKAREKAAMKALRH